MGARVIKSITMIVMSLALFALLGTTPANAAFPGDNGRLAFVRAGNVFTINPDGTGLRQLNTDGDNAHPRWSPDGRRIAYLTGGELWVLNADGTGKRSIWKPYEDLRANQPAWSPDGWYLAMNVSELDQSAVLKRISVADGTVANFTEGPENAWVSADVFNSDIAWSPDGRKILYAGGTCEAPSQDCFTQLTLDSPSATHGTTDVIDHGIRSPDWQLNSGDYTWTTSNSDVQFSDYGDSGVYIPNAEDSIYSPSHGHIAFIRIQGSARYVTIANVDGSDKRRLGPGIQVDWQPLP